MVDSNAQHIFFVENQPENYITFEVEPVDSDSELDLDVKVKFSTEYSTNEGLSLKSLIRECLFTIYSEQVNLISIISYVHKKIERMTPDKTFVLIWLS